MTTYVNYTCDCSGEQYIVSQSPPISNAMKEPEDMKQKRMWNQVRTPASSYSLNLAALAVAASSDADGTVAVKHASYDRYLARKKGGNLLTEATPATTAKYGNKTRMYGMISNASSDCANICPM